MAAPVKRESPGSGHGESQVYQWRPDGTYNGWFCASNLSAQMGLEYMT